MQLTVRDTAKLLNISESTVYHWIRDKGLPAKNLSGQYRFNRGELFEWATAQGIKISADVLKTQESAILSRNSFAAALERGGIHYAIKGSEKIMILQRIVELMPLPPKTDRSLLLRFLLAREALASTGIGEGIAIPHPRNPIVLNISEPIITLCFLDQPIDYDAIDGKLVDTLFTLVTPNVRIHLHILSKLALALREPSFKKLLEDRNPKEEILNAARKFDEDGIK